MAAGQPAVIFFVGVEKTAAVYTGSELLNDFIRRRENCATSGLELLVWLIQYNTLTLFLLIKLKRNWSSYITLPEDTFTITYNPGITREYLFTETNTIYYHCLSLLTLSQFRLFRGQIGGATTLPGGKCPMGICQMLSSGCWFLYLKRGNICGNDHLVCLRWLGACSKRGRSSTFLRYIFEGLVTFV